MEFKDFQKNVPFYTKDGMWAVLSKDEEKQTVEVCANRELYHWNMGNKQYVDIITLKEEDFEGCRLCNTFL